MSATKVNGGIGGGEMVTFKFGLQLKVNKPVTHTLSQLSESQPALEAI